ncbi:unnamed protein product [Rotaria magnacalcarata]|uniref:Cytokinin riboside 5'-monophosphate phosphoribohydrolase n=1 Tax=Rotaria magnacalcarata TaxID=392030 RepID=A0A816TE45_9BILA|nr:unnamed protein product [Rotaria magnacalcarata]CAF2177839.1 unnamed protein product [Rotaria magnacalcarata]CAF3980888.1 unnamed protein product [Rotaria magnacalcarata]CAF4053649.1 unnamed protein product [Rotaria magnacalcarata]
MVVSKHVDLEVYRLCLKEASELFNMIFDGCKPTLPPILIDQLTRMEKEGFLPEQTLQYCNSTSLQNVDKATLRTKGKTHIHPLPVKLMHARNEVCHMLHGTGISLEKIFIPGVDDRLNRRNHLCQQPLAVIVLPGDIVTVKTVLELLLTTITRQFKSSQRIVWVNIDGYWNNLFQYLGISTCDNYLVSFDVTIVSSLESIVGSLSEFCRSEVYMPKEVCDTLDSNEITLFFNTTSPNKIRDAKRICKGLNLPIKVLPIAVLTDGPVRTAEEQSATYQGNLEEKLHASTSRLHELGREFIHARLKDLNIEITKAYVCAHDGGVSLSDYILNHQCFDCLRQERTPIKLGVETKCALHQMHGAKELNYAMNRVYEEYKTPLEHRVIIEQDTGVFYSLKDALYDQIHVPVYLYNCTKCRLSLEARPNTITPEYYHYTIVEDKTLAEWARDDLKSFAKFNAFGGIISAFVQIIGLEPKQEFIQQSTELNDLRIALLTTDITEIPGVVNDLYNCLANTKKFIPSIEIFPDIPIVLQDKIFANFDAFIFVPSLSINNDPVAHWKSIFAFYSILVGLELEDPFLANKQVILYDPENTNFKVERDFYTCLYNNGMSSQLPEDMFFVASSQDEIIECLQCVSKIYSRQKLPIYEREQVDFPDKQGKFNVALYLSASSENSEYLDFTRRITSQLVHRNFGIVSGGAAQGPMGAIHEALTPSIVEELHCKGIPISNIGIYTRETKLREGIPQNKLTWAHQASDLYYRMQLMEHHSDVFMILPGGKGIMQEISKLMIAKLKNHETVKNKHIVIYNWQIKLMIEEESGRKILTGFYTQLIDLILSQQQQQQHPSWLHVVTNVEEAMDILEKLRMENHKRITKLFTTTSSFRNT